MPALKLKMIATGNSTTNTASSKIASRMTEISVIVFMVVFIPGIRCVPAAGSIAAGKVVACVHRHH